MKTLPQVSFLEEEIFFRSFHFMRLFLVSPEAEEVSALVSALAHQQSRAESEAENAAAGGSDDEDFIGMKKDPFFGKLKRTFTASRYHVIIIIIVIKILTLVKILKNYFIIDRRCH